MAVSSRLLLLFVRSRSLVPLSFSRFALVLSFRSRSLVSLSFSRLARVLSFRSRSLIPFCFYLSLSLSLSLSRSLCSVLLLLLRDFFSGCTSGPPVEFDMGFPCQKFIFFALTWNFHVKPVEKHFDMDDMEMFDMELHVKSFKPEMDSFDMEFSCPIGSGNHM